MAKKVKTIVEVTNMDAFNKLVAADAKLVFVNGYKTEDEKRLLFGTGISEDVFAIGYTSEHVVWIKLKLRAPTAKEGEEFVKRVHEMRDDAEAYPEISAEFRQRRVDDLEEVKLFTQVKKIDFRI